MFITFISYCCTVRLSADSVNKGTYINKLKNEE